jgi:hypothetical protein
VEISAAPKLQGSKIRGKPFGAAGGRWQLSHENESRISKTSQNLPRERSVTMGAAVPGRSIGFVLTNA